MTDPAEGIDADGYITTGTVRTSLRGRFLDEFGGWLLRRVDEITAENQGGGGP